MPDILVSDLVGELLKKGYHPYQIRRQLQARGVPWSYKYGAIVDGRSQRIQGKRECARRLRQLGLVPCEGGCGEAVRTDREPKICDACLDKKWAV